MKTLLSHWMSAIALAATNAVSAQTLPAEASVAVFAGHYAFAGRAYDDVDRLEAAVRTAGPHSLTLDACGPGSTRALLAVAHRLRHLPIRIRVQEPQASACASSAAGVVNVGAGPRPLGIDDETVGRYWQQLLP